MNEKEYKEILRFPRRNCYWNRIDKERVSVAGKSWNKLVLVFWEGIKCWSTYDNFGTPTHAIDTKMLFFWHRISSATRPPRSFLWIWAAGHVRFSVTVNWNANIVIGIKFWSTAYTKIEKKHKSRGLLGGACDVTQVAVRVSRANGQAHDHLMIVHQCSVAGGQCVFFDF